MCVVSMVIDHYYDEWGRRRRPDFSPYGPDSFPPTPQDFGQSHEGIQEQIKNLLKPKPPAITNEEVEEFRRLLDRAREYDRKHSQPECEMAEKKRKLLKLAEDLGVRINFDDPPPAM